MNRGEKILLFFILFFLFFILHFNSFTSPFERDEGEYAYSAMILKQGLLPYKHAFVQKPPMIIYTYFLGQLIDKEAVWPPRLLMAVVTILSTIVIGLIAKKEWGETARWITMFIFLPMVSFPVLTPFAANTEKFMILPLLVVVYIFLIHKETKKLFWWFIGGIFAALAFSYKPISLPVIIYIFFLWSIKNYRLEKNLKKLFNKILAGFFGFFLIISLTISPFIITKTLNYLIELVIIFNFHYVKNFGNGWLNFVNYLKKFFFYWYILIPFLIFLFYRRPKNFFFYFFLFLISLLTVFQSPMGHYYLQVIPFLTLLVSGSIIELTKSTRIEKRKLLNILIPFIIIIFLLYPIKNQFYLNPDQLTLWIYGSVNPFVEAPIVANFVKKKTRENDKIFVAGSEPQIYFYSQRQSISRFIITYPLNLETPFRQKYQKEVINNLIKNKPKIIIVSQRKHSGLWDEESPRFFIDFLTNFLKKNYDLVGGYVWNNYEGDWKEKLDKIDIQNSSYLVYIKNRD